MGECEKLASTVERYQERFARVLAHVETNSETALSIDELSGIAAFSRHHFHRQFTGFLGMSAYRYVQFIRMRRASWRLAFRPELSVGEIALATGYEGPEAFARAFRQYSGQSPSEFRVAAGLDRMAFALPAVHTTEANNDEHHRGAACRARDDISRDSRG